MEGAYASDKGREELEFMVVEDDAADAIHRDQQPFPGASPFRQSKVIDQSTDWLTMGLWCNDCVCCVCICCVYVVRSIRSLPSSTCCSR